MYSKMILKAGEKDFVFIFGFISIFRFHLEYLDMRERYSRSPYNSKIIYPLHNVLFSEEFHLSGVFLH